MRRMTLAAAILAIGVLAGCAVGPNYHRPPVQAPSAYKTEGPWRVAAPKDSIPKGAWWEIFNDAELNAYEQQLLQANQSLAAAKDRLDEARSLARVTSAGYFPTSALIPMLRASGIRAIVRKLSLWESHSRKTSLKIPFLLNYEPDLFGKVRRSLQASNASLQATAADMYNVNLVLTAELAADYFMLRELDAETQVVQESVTIQQKGLQLVEDRHAGGVASGLDLAQQQTLLDSTTTQLYLVQQQRAQFEHAIAVLTGNPASTFSVPVRPLNETPPPVPLGVPSDLLERRPDIADGRAPDGLRERAGRSRHGGVLSAAHHLRRRRFSEHQHHQPDHRAQRHLVARRRLAAADL